MSNPANSGVIVGRLAADPKFIKHSKGNSGTALLTVYAEDNYTRRDGTRGSVRIDLEDYIVDANNPGPYSFLRKGMLVAVNYSVANNDYTDKQGKKHYGMRLVVERNGIKSLESRGAVAQREQRAAQAQNQAPAQNQQPAQAEQAEQGAPAPGIGQEQQAAQPAQPQAQAQTFNQLQEQGAPAQAQADNVPF